MNTDSLIGLLNDALPAIKIHYGDNGLFTKKFEAALSRIEGGGCVKCSEMEGDKA
jgi:hypothetical protein